MATSSIQPELSNTTVEGYFYKRTTGEADEKNKKYKGASKKAYAVNEFKEKYYESDSVDFLTFTAIPLKLYAALWTEFKVFIRLITTVTASFICIRIPWNINLR